MAAEQATAGRVAQTLLSRAYRPDTGAGPLPARRRHDVCTLGVRVWSASRWGSNGHDESTTKGTVRTGPGLSGKAASALAHLLPSPQARDERAQSRLLPSPQAGLKADPSSRPAQAPLWPLTGGLRRASGETGRRMCDLRKAAGRDALRRSLPCDRHHPRPAVPQVQYRARMQRRRSGYDHDVARLSRVRLS